MKLFRLTVTVPPGTPPPPPGTPPPPPVVKSRDVPHLLASVVMDGTITLRRVS